MQNLLLMGCSGLVHMCKCRFVIVEQESRLAFVLEKRLDFHLSDAMLNLAGGKDNHTKVIL